jgi:hypothetical protein
MIIQVCALPAVILIDVTRWTIVLFVPRVHKLQIKMPLACNTEEVFFCQRLSHSGDLMVHNQFGSKREFSQSGIPRF